MGTDSRTCTGKCLGGDNLKTTLCALRATAGLISIGMQDRLPGLTWPCACQRSQSYGALPGAVVPALTRSVPGPALGVLTLAVR